MSPAKMRLLPEYINAIREGHKTTTIRLGKRSISTSTLILESDIDSIEVQVTSIYHKKFQNLTKADAQKDGFTTLQELKTALSMFYPNIKPNAIVTLIEFKV